MTPPRVEPPEELRDRDGWQSHEQIIAALRAERDAAMAWVVALADKLQPFADAYEANKFSSLLQDMMMSVAPQHWSDAAAALAAYRAASPELKP